MFPSECSISGKFSEYIDIIMSRQLLSARLWQNCVNVFSSGIDDADRGWRGEYWGKMMRGACLVYRVTRSEELYAALTDAVEGLLSKQEPDGRISSYSRENEFYGWDIWSRKYVMTGLQHYCDICRDEALRGRIITALTLHADYIIARVGKDKIPLLDTGLYWGGVNSASILEPFVRLYIDTGKKEYLSFAQYIISTGGCSDGSLIDCVSQGRAPFEFPETKAYETMSFFEGLLAYYELTGNEFYLTAVRRFVSRLLETDYTAIGSCGCTHELFDNSTLRQTEPSDNIMQETCVTVTLMRLLARLYFVTGEKELFAALRLSALNALSGALNINGYEQYSNEKKEYLPGMVFDSYSPLCDGRRGRGIGGFKQFADKSHFGCCACIASAGFALYPLMCVTRHGEEIRVNDIQNGEYSFAPEGGSVTLAVTGDKISVSAPSGVRFTLLVTQGFCGTAVESRRAGERGISQAGYDRFDNVSHGNEIKLKIENKLVQKRINGKVSLSFGGFTLAADEMKSQVYKPGQKLNFILDAGGDIQHEILPPQKGEQVRIAAATDRGTLILTDYAGAGQDGKSRVTVWF